MREIKAETISAAIKGLCIATICQLPEVVVAALNKYKDKEESPVAKEILGKIIDNAKVAAEGEYPLCQDCGFSVFLVEVGNDVHISGASLRDAIDEGVRQGYGEGCGRKSILEHPVQRVNTGDNTPSVIHVFPTMGDKLVIHLAAKGGGSENMSRVNMMKPSDGREGIIDWVVSVVEEAGPNPCPPTVVGVGMGGTFEYAALMAKKALFRKIGEPSPHEFNAGMEAEILEKVNKLGIGPMGLGGRTTSLGVAVEHFACHIATMPVAVNINCHSARHKTIEL